MERLVARVRRFAEELRRRRGILVAVVYTGTAFGQSWEHEVQNGKS